MPILVARGKDVVKKVCHWKRGPPLYHGRYGAIFQGTDKDALGCNQKIAVKSIPLKNIDALRSITNERKMLEKLSKCPQVVQFLGTSISERVKGFVDKRVMNLFLEYMPKGDLHRRLHSSCEGGPILKLPEGVCKTYTRDLLQALSFMHALGIVHGNINGSNVLVGDKMVKLCDFGLSWNVKCKMPKWILDSHVRLEHQQKVPESFLEGPKLGTPMDVFSLGCLVCEMLMGRRPRLHDVKSNLAQGLEENHIPGPLNSSNLISVEIPKYGWEDKTHAHDFIAKCLIKEPKLRWTADQLRKHPWIEENDNLTIEVNMNRLHTLHFRTKS